MEDAAYGQILFELFAGAMQAHLYGVKADAEDFGDLAARPIHRFWFRVALFRAMRRVCNRIRGPDDEQWLVVASLIDVKRT